MMLLTRVNYRFAFIVHGLQLSLHLIRRSAGLSACFVHDDYCDPAFCSMLGSMQGTVCSQLFVRMIVMDRNDTI
jgi:hypothetical protein